MRLERPLDADGGAARTAAGTQARTGIGLAAGERMRIGRGRAVSASSSRCADRTRPDPCRRQVERGGGHRATRMGIVEPVHGTARHGSARTARLGAARRGSARTAAGPSRRTGSGCRGVVRVGARTQTRSGSTPCRRQAERGGSCWSNAPVEPEPVFGTGNRDDDYGRRMDMSSMIMGGAIASVMWIVFVPWSKLRRLRELDERDEHPDGD